MTSPVFFIPEIESSLSDDITTDIANYAYVWYTKENPLTKVSQEDLDKIHKIIINYSYPCYLGNGSIRGLAPDDKKKIIYQELLFIREKMAEVGLSHITIIQIPRILYDLFNLHYTTSTDEVRSKFVTSASKMRFIFECDMKIETMAKYNALVHEYTESVKENILLLNEFIIEELNSLAQRRGSSFVEFLSHIEEEYNAILEYLFERSLFIINAFLRSNYGLTKEDTKNIFLQTIRFEQKYSSGDAILYRGGVFDKDSLIYHSPPGRSGSTFDLPNGALQSISFNSSMLSGFVNDQSSCTLNYIDKTMHSTVNKESRVNDKIKYSIRKFIPGELSNEASLFFIPPIHPFLQLYSQGELFHPRTKFGNDYVEVQNGELIKCEKNAETLKNIVELLSPFIIYDKVLTKTVIRPPPSLPLVAEGAEAALVMGMSSQLPLVAEGPIKKKWVPLSAATRRRMEFAGVKNPDGSFFESGEVGGKRRKHNQKRSTNKKCRIHKKSGRIS